MCVDNYSLLDIIYITSSARENITRSRQV